MLEKEIEGIFVKSVQQVGGKAYKFNSAENSGVPDRIVVLPCGVVCFVELKSKSGRLTEIQKHQIKELERRGHKVYVTYGLSGVVEFWKELSKSDPVRELRGLNKFCSDMAAWMKKQYRKQLQEEGYGV